MTSRIALLIAIAAGALALAPTGFAEGRLAGSPERVDAVAYFYANERATLGSDGTSIVTRGDDYAYPDPGAVTTPVVTAGSNGDVEWAQLGIGFGLGILLAAGLWTGARLAKRHVFAH